MNGEILLPELTKLTSHGGEKKNIGSQKTPTNKTK
jgi:hypothetical protein